MNISGRKSSSTPRKRVAFAEYSTLIVTRPKTRMEVKSGWYTKAEMKAFKCKAGMTARNIVETNPAAAKEYIKKSIEADSPEIESNGIYGIAHVCGLEHMLDEQLCKLLVVSRSLTVKRVIEEQKRQKHAGKMNSDVLAQVSTRSSTFAVLWRRRIARLNGANQD